MQAICLAFIPLLLAQTSTSQSSGLFEPNGGRMESATLVEPDTKEKLRARCKSISIWTDQALTARSVAFREQAANTILHIVVFHDEKQQTLTEGEIKLCRETALKFLGSKDDATRRCGVQSLEAIGDSECVKALVRCLNDKDAVVRFGAMEALGEHGDDSAIPPPLAQAKADSPDDGFAEAAVVALGKIGTPAAKAALEKVLIGTKDEAFREAVLAAIDAIERK